MPLTFGSSSLRRGWFGMYHLTFKLIKQSANVSNNIQLIIHHLALSVDFGLPSSIDNGFVDIYWVSFLNFATKDSTFVRFL